MHKRKGGLAFGNKYTQEKSNSITKYYITY